MVVDELGRSAVFRREVVVRERCPADMVSSFDSKGRAFCIDRYEWPNRRGERPLVNVSWVEAVMYCRDAGKRLCTSDEWVSACANSAQTMYPYGDRYDAARCATEEKAPVASGAKTACVSGGVADMLGNVGEWVHDKSGDYARAFGGSFRYGRDAHCRFEFRATIATRSDETGFRCCR
jgi:eukaryotic-like serine/threonine-protein kinase